MASAFSIGFVAEKVVICAVANLAVMQWTAPAGVWTSNARDNAQEQGRKSEED